MKKFVVAIGLLGASVCAQASSWTGMYVFGDSLADPGNAYALSGGVFPPTPSHRFTDGPTAVEQLATALGLSATGNYASPAGTNYAVGGGMSGNGNYNFQANSPAGINAVAPLANTGVTQQVARFNANNPTYNSDTTLFVVNGGANDWFLRLSNPAPLDFVQIQQLASQSAANIAANIQTLYQDGARHFLVPNLPDIGATPAFAGNPQGQGASNGYAVIYNAVLAASLANLQVVDTGISITLFDSFQFLNDVLAAPAAYGITNTTDMCAYLASCQGYLFWDSVHPSAYASASTAAAYARAVPVPGSLALLGLGMLGFAALRRKAA